MIPEYRRGVLPLPQADVDHTARQRARAIVAVCGLADGRPDHVEAAAHVLEVLGLDPREARPVLATSPSENTTEEIDQR